MSAAQYSFSPPVVGTPGQRASNPAVVNVDSPIYPSKAQLSTITMVGTDDGTYTIRIALPDGRFFDASFVAVSKTAVQITAGLLAALAALLGLKGIVSATSPTTTTIALAFLAYGIPYSVSFPSNPGDNLSIVLTTNPEVSMLRLGIGCVLYESNGAILVRPPAATDTASDIAGIIIRDDSTLAALNVAANRSVDGYLPGTPVPVAFRGDYWVDVENAVAYRGQAFVRCTATGAEVFGAIRGDDDGGDAVPIRAYFMRATTGAGRTQIRLDLPAAGIPSIDDVTDLVDDSGGAAADGTVEVITAPTAIAATLTDSTGLGASHNDTIAAAAALTDYVPHGAGATPVTSAGATDLDLVKVALETFRDEQAARNTVLLQNDSDLAQKIIELVARQAENLAAIVAVTDAVAELADKQNETLAALRT